VEVDATIDGEEENAAAGVACRASDYGNYYRFGVFVDGWAFIAKLSDGELVELASGDHSDALGGNDRTPHIRADCVGSKLTLYINDQKVEEAEDSEFESGSVGLLANNDDDATVPADVTFDDFLVSSL
jgi:hypothetical protein